MGYAYSIFISRKERLKQAAIMKLQEKLKYFKKYNVCSIIFDAGIVRKLTHPGFLNPIQYRSIPCKNLIHAGYMKITNTITK